MKILRCTTTLGLLALTGLTQAQNIVPWTEQNGTLASARISGLVAQLRL